MFGGEVLEGIGSSEMYHIYISNRPGSSKIGSVGPAVPGYDATIRDLEGKELPDDQAGELWVEGDSAAVMYWRSRQSSKRPFYGGRVRTGDYFVRDADGYFWFHGRADHLMKVGGIWVAPDQIENCLLEHPLVTQVAVVPYDDQGLKLPRAYVVAREDPHEGLAEELKDFVRSKLSPHKVPRDERFVDDLPKTGSGKIDRRSLADL
ncbi:MAG: AMP-binding protein [Actinobacteria bacterium]|nr:AMP-binding protein [Actinomycetota bacterium]